MPEDGSASRSPAQNSARTAIILVGLCALLNLLSRGSGETFTTFLLALTAEFQANRADVAAIYSLQMLLAGICAPLAGYCFDRFGPLKLYIGGLLLLIAGLLLASFAGAVWQMYIFIGIGVGGAAAALGNAPHSALLARWFDGNGLTRSMSVVYAGLGVGSLLLVPLAQLVIETWGWRNAYRMLAVIALAAMPALLLVSWPVVQAGRVRLPPSPKKDGDMVETLMVTEWTIGKAMRNPAFWGLTSVFCFTSAGMFSVLVQAVAYLVELGYAPLKAASIYGLIGVLTPVGILGFSWLDARIGRHSSAALSYSFSLLGLGSLWALKLWQSPLLLWSFVLLVGLSFGARGPMVGATAARIFHGPRFGVIFGTIMVGSGFGIAFGTFTGAILHDITGGYTGVFLFSAVCILMGAMPFWTYRSLRAYGP
ncbi:MFS transporter [Ferrovibrio terrae]|uniref:MFS transporter n=1 Tax=Ferrovibrio terrae TaxID=2594003 RepID=UPI0031381677